MCDLNIGSGHANLGLNIFHISYTVIIYPFLFNFYICCLDLPGIKGNKNMIDTCFVLEDIKFMDFRVFESAFGSQGVISSGGSRSSHKVSGTWSKFPNLNENGQKSHFCEVFLTQNLVNILSGYAS